MFRPRLKIVFYGGAPRSETKSPGCLRVGLLSVGFATHLGERTTEVVCFVADGRLLPVLGRATVEKPELKSGELSWCGRSRSGHSEDLVRRRAADKRAARRPRL